MRQIGGECLAGRRLFDNCVNVDASIYCDNDGGSDDGSISNPDIDVDDWFLLTVGTVAATSGTVTFGSVGWNGYYE